MTHSIAILSRTVAACRTEAMEQKKKRNRNENFLMPRSTNGTPEATRRHWLWPSLSPCRRRVPLPPMLPCGRNAHAPLLIATAAPRAYRQSIVRRSVACALIRSKHLHAVGRTLIFRNPCYRF